MFIPSQRPPIPQPFFNVRDFGATGDGVTDDAPAFRLAFAAADASESKSTVYFPGGTYLLGKDGANFWHINVACSNVVVVGEPGKTVFKAEAGQSAQVRLFHLDDLDNVTFRNILFDGNWGNALTTIAEASDDTAANGTTYNVEDTTDFPASGTFTLVTATESQIITYTSLTATTFLGCTGGTGTLKRGYKVGYVDGNTGINHDTQADPKNHALMIRGSRDVVIEDCEFRNVYGDCIWTGLSSDGDLLNPSRRVRIIRCKGSLSARLGIALAQPTDTVTMEDCDFGDAWQGAFDIEPQGTNTPVRNVYLNRTRFGLWWNPYEATRTYNLAVSIIGAYFAAGPENVIRTVHLDHCLVEGGLKAYFVTDLSIRNCRFVLDHGASSGAPIYLDHCCEDYVVEGNYIYDRADTPLAYVHQAGIHVIPYPYGLITSTPIGGRIANNQIHVRNGYSGIFVDPNSGYALYPPGGLVTPESNSSTSVTATTLTRTGAAWTVDKWNTWRVRIGATTATIISNTSEVLTLTGWFTPLGDPAPTPASGAYSIFNASGLIDIVDNEIDCTDDGYGAGLYGIYFAAQCAGGRVKLCGNKIKNATDYGVHAISTDADFLEISDNTFWDDQGTQTMFHAIRFNAPVYVDKLVMRNNAVCGPNAINPLSGLASGTTPAAWIIVDGPSQAWEGYDAPEGVITATVGSTFRRRDGAAGTVYYVKETGTGNTGWIALNTAVAATGSIQCTTFANYVDGDYMTIPDAILGSKLYEFDKVPDGVTGGRIVVDISGATTAAQCAAILKTAIEANQPTLSVTDTGAGGLSLQHKIAGVIGNVTISENVTSAQHTVAGMTGGVGR